MNKLRKDSFSIPRPATYAWAGLIGYIVSVDAFLIFIKNSKDKEEYVTMSVLFNEALLNKRTKIIVPIISLMVNLHLFKPYLPDVLHKFDPITGIADFLSPYSSLK